MTKKDDDIEARTLSKIIPGMQVTSDGDPSTPLVFDGQSSWQEGTVVIDGTQYYVLYANDYFDLSGYSLQDKTLFIQNVMIQECPNVFGSFNAFISRIVSKTPIPLSSMEITSPSRTWALPGNSANTYTMDQIVMGDCALWTVDSTLSSSIPLSRALWGEGNATAADKLYIGVAIAFPKSQPQQIIFPDTNFVIPAFVAKEDELPYMMRLSRSLEPVY